MAAYETDTKDFNDKLRLEFEVIGACNGIVVKAGKAGDGGIWDITTPNEYHVFTSVAEVAVFITSRIKEEWS